MARRSNKSIQEILGQQQSRSTEGFTTSVGDHDDKELDRKITLTTEGFTTTKYCELILRDRTRLSKENALTVCDYIMDMKREINPSLNTIRTTIQFFSELCKCVKNKWFEEMTRDDILLFLDQCRKLDNDDPMHKWINTYNSKRTVLFRFFKWLQYRNVTGDPNKRNELSVEQRKPKCIQDIPRLKRKEISSYKPTDLWTPQDDLLFLKYVTNKRDRCYHMMSRDLSARPHEILGLRIKDVVFKTVDGGKQYAEVLVNGKTGSRHIPLIQSIPYIKDWLSDHPSRNNPNSPIFVSLSNHSNGRKRLTINGLYEIYNEYKKVFFPKLLSIIDPSTTISSEDRDKIKALLDKPFNPYIRRHTGLTEKSTKLKAHTLKQYAGWSINSGMAEKYIHYFGNESCESLLEAYGIVTKNNSSVDVLNPKICPNCNEGNAQDARFCSKCRMIMSYEGYQEALESQKRKEDEITDLKKRQERFELLIQSLIDSGQLKPTAIVNNT
jgi:integrase/recombinase XerD